MVLLGNKQGETSRHYHLDWTSEVHTGGKMSLQGFSVYTKEALPRLEGSLHSSVFPDNQARTMSRPFASERVDIALVLYYNARRCFHENCISIALTSNVNTLAPAIRRPCFSSEPENTLPKKGRPIFIL